MLFTSYAFLGFVAVLFLLYYIVPRRWQWGLLLGASYLFYALAGTEYLAYILVTTVTVYYTALRIERNADRQTGYLKEHKNELTKEEKKAYKDRQKSIRLRWILAGLLLNLGILAVVKYTNFAIANLNGLLHAFGKGESRQLSFLDLALPLGISFYTFQALGYLIDVYRGTVRAQRNFFRFALFVSFFPQLVQGPISRFGDLSQTLYAEHAFDKKTFSFGLQRILWGYFKKLVIADRMLVGVNALIGDPEAYQGAWVLVGMFFYACELYADFTGGIDITIGIAQTLGITLQENFERPFFSRSLKEYWRRWHITMGTWFRDYIFYPISVCKFMQKFNKACRRYLGEAVGKRLPVYLSSFVVWFATGIWHGASWNFIVWGLGNWAVLMVSETLEPLYDRFHQRFGAGGKAYRLFEVVRTFLLVSALRTFDCYRSVPVTFRMFGTLFTARNWNILWDGSLLGLGLSLLDYGILAVGVLMLVSVSLLQRHGSVRERIFAKPYPLRFVLWYGLFLTVLLMGAYGVGYDASQFIYNQF